MKTRKIVAVGAMLAILVASYFTDKAPAAVRSAPSLGPTLHSLAPVHGPLAAESGHSSVTLWSSPVSHSDGSLTLIFSSPS